MLFQGTVSLLLGCMHVALSELTFHNQFLHVMYINFNYFIKKIVFVINIFQVFAKTSMKDLVAKSRLLTGYLELLVNRKKRMTNSGKSM